MEIVEKFTSKQRKRWNAYPRTRRKDCFVLDRFERPIIAYSFKQAPKLSGNSFKSVKMKRSEFGSFILLPFFK